MAASTVKTFSLSSCDWIGFDLDHTLIRYRLFELHTLIYRGMCQYLVEKENYNRQLLQIPYDDHFAVKGLIYDSVYGNLIQLDSNGSVHTALHGRNERLSSQKIKELYPNELKEIDEDVSKRYLCMFTYFESSIAFLIAVLIDLIDQQILYEKNETKIPIAEQADFDTRYSSILLDLRSGYQYLFDDFKRADYFSSVRSDPDKYIYRRSDVRRWLEKLRDNHKRLFLATNSRFDYTDVLSKHAFGDDWQMLFDIIIVDCKKPSFFYDSKSSSSNANKQIFYRIEGEEQVPTNNEQMIAEQGKNCIYAGGNSEDLHTIMSTISGKDPLVIYFGDHIKSDINALKRHTNWLAGAVVEELEFDSPPQTSQVTTHRSSNRTSTNDSPYARGNPSKYFASFLTAPNDATPADEQTEPDALLPSLSSYWHTYITKHAHLSLSCLSVLANHFDLEHEFEHENDAQHLVLLHDDTNK